MLTNGHDDNNGIANERKLNARSSVVERRMFGEAFNNIIRDLLSHLFLAGNIGRFISHDLRLLDKSGNADDNHSSRGFSIMSVLVAQPGTFV